MRLALYGVGALGLIAQGCEVPERPGELVGRYQITGALIRNDCGPEALPAEDPLSFEVEIRDDQGVGIWYMSGPQGISGTLGPDGSFRFQQNQVTEVVAPGTRTVEQEEPSDFYAPDTRVTTNEAGCQMRITELVAGSVHRDARTPSDPDLAVSVADADSTSLNDLTGTNQIEVARLDGADCDDSLAANGGPFRSLPCIAEYDIVGTLLGN